MKPRSEADPGSLTEWSARFPEPIGAALAAAVALANQSLDASPESSQQAPILEQLKLLQSLGVDQETLAATLIQPFYTQLPTTAQSNLHAVGLRSLLDGQAQAEKVWALHARKSAHTNAEGLRRLLLALIGDLRVIFILLARQLVAMRGATRASDEERRRLGQLSADIHAPLANRLGIWQLKWELEDLAFRFLQPQAYKRVAQMLDERRVDRERHIALVIDELRAILDGAGIRAEIAGRPKHMWSIWKKMQRKSVDFSELYDVRAVRLLVPDVPSCYAALGVVHAHWTPISKEFDDYIARPKGNDYRSLHTAVIGPEGKTLEVQIRSHAMHEHAELGVAAHWRYKEGGGSGSSFDRKIQAMRGLLESRDDSGDDDGLLAGYSVDMLEDRVYVLTPQGEVIDLPKGGTVLDFAYSVHTTIGHRCRGAKVDGRIVPLNHCPKTGSQIEILTAKEAHPKRDWVLPQNGYLASPRARHKVRAWFNKLDREQNLRDGRDIVEREVKRPTPSNARLTAILPKLHLESIDDLYVAVALGDLSPAQIVRLLLEADAPKQDEAQILAQRRMAGEAPKRDKDAIVIDGIGNLLIQMAGCCNPVPGDRVLGFVTKGRGVSIHRADCRSLQHLQTRSPDRVVEVQWGGRSVDRYPVRVRIDAYNRTGLIRDIGAVLAAEQINIGAMDSRVDPVAGSAQLLLTLRVASAEQLSAVLGKLRAIASVSEAERVG